MQTIEPGPNKPPLIERAFELARSGEYPRKADIVRELKREGYDRPDQMLHGVAMGCQLRQANALAQLRIALEKP